MYIFIDVYMYTLMCMHTYTPAGYSEHVIVTRSSVTTLAAVWIASGFWSNEWYSGRSMNLTIPFNAKS